MIPYEGLLCAPEWSGKPGVSLLYIGDQDTERRQEPGQTVDSVLRPETKQHKAAISSSGK